jgi:hypothetical protein
VTQPESDLKLLLKRGALIAAANWPAVAVQFVGQTTFQALLAVPILGAAVLVAVLIGADLGELLQGSLREVFATITATLTSQPAALVCFIVALAIALVGGSALMFFIKGGIVDVLLAADEGAGPIEREPVTLGSLRAISRFTLPRFTHGCSRLFPRYLALGCVLMVVYAVSGAGYLAFVVYGYQAAAGLVLVIGWTVVVAAATAGLIAWITLVNLVYLLLQIAIAVDNLALVESMRTVARFLRSEFRELAGVFLVILALVIAATLASTLAWSGVGLIAFVPLVGLAVFPIQIVALLVRGLAFEYIGLAAMSTYVTLYRRPRTKAAPLRPSGSAADEGE